MVLDLEVEALELSHPADLPWLQFLGFLEVMEVCVVHPDLDCLIHSDKVCLPLMHCLDHCQELLVIHIVVLLSCSEGLGDIVYDSPSPIHLLLREHSTCRQVAHICLYLPSP